MTTFVQKARRLGSNDADERHEGRRINAWMNWQVSCVAGKYGCTSGQIPTSLFIMLSESYISRLINLILFASGRGRSLSS